MKRAAILLYHSIFQNVSSSDVFSLRVSEANFAEHMSYISQERTILPLREFLALLEKDRLPSDAVAITFDDGYRDNLLLAVPILRHTGTPATFFLSTGLLGREFWWDRLERIVFSLKELPPQIQLDDKSRSLCLTVGGEKDANRFQVFMQFWNFVRGFDARTREQLVDALADKLGSARDSDLLCALEPREVISLATSPFEIGAHSVTHRSLSDLCLEDLEWEVAESKRNCEALGSCSVSSFSYPHGEFDPTVQRIVAEAGFKIGCAVEDTFVDSTSSPFTLPRIHVKNWTADELARRLGEDA